MTAPLRPRPIRIGMVGSGFMAQQHSAAYRLLSLTFGDTVPPIELVRIAGGRRVDEVGPRYGWQDTTDDWRAVTEADDIDVVDVVTPDDSHAALTISAAEHGKHVVCEKPPARDAAEAEAMRDAVVKAGAPYLPIAGIGMGYQQSFVVLLGRFLAALHGGTPAPSIDEGVTISRYLDAAVASARGGGWVGT